MGTTISKNLSVNTDITIYESTAGSFQRGDSDGISVQIVNTGSNPLTDFSVEAKGPNSQTWSSVKSADFVGTPGDTFPVFATKDPVTLAAGDSLILLLGGNFYQWRLLASSASGTTVDIHAFGDRA